MNISVTNHEISRNRIPYYINIHHCSLILLALIQSWHLLYNCNSEKKKVISFFSLYFQPLSSCRMHPCHLFIWNGIGGKNPKVNYYDLLYCIEKKHMPSVYHKSKHLQNVHAAFVQQWMNTKCCKAPTITKSTTTKQQCSYATCAQYSKFSEIVR